MKKAISLVIAATAVIAAVPAAAQDQERRPAARKACATAERCDEARRAYPWFFRGQDEGAQVRRQSRRSSQDD